MAISNPKPHYPRPMRFKFKAADGKEVEITDPHTLERVILQQWNAIYSLSGKTPGGSLMQGPINMNGNVITGVTNSSTPADDEALSVKQAKKLFLSSSATLDDISAGGTFTAVHQTAVSEQGFVNPAKPGFSTMGSVPPAWTALFGFTSTTNSIHLYWDGVNAGSSAVNIFRADGTTSGPFVGDQNVTGLSASTTYYFYPYFDEFNQLVWFPQGGVGVPDIAFTARSQSAAQSQGLQSRIPLSQGAVAAATTSSGTGGGTGGGSGCLLASMLVNSRGRGKISIGQAEIGEQILGGGGWTVIVRKRVTRQDSWLAPILAHGDGLIATPRHPIMLASGEQVANEDLRLYESVRTISEPEAVIGIAKAEGWGDAVAVTCAPFDTFFAGFYEPSIEVHNWVAVK
jgi:hypothetical protein